MLGKQAHRCTVCASKTVNQQRKVEHQSQLASITVIQRHLRDWIERNHRVASAVAIHRAPGTRTGNVLIGICLACCIGAGAILLSCANPSFKCIEARGYANQTLFVGTTHDAVYVLRSEPNDRDWRVFQASAAFEAISRQSEVAKEESALELRATHTEQTNEAAADLSITCIGCIDELEHNSRKQDQSALRSPMLEFSVQEVTSVYDSARSSSVVAMEQSPLMTMIVGFFITICLHNLYISVQSE